MSPIVAMAGGFVEQRRFSRVEQAIEQIDRPYSQAEYKPSGRSQRKRKAVSEEALPEHRDHGRIQAEQVGPQPERNGRFLRVRGHPIPRYEVRWWKGKFQGACG